MFSFKEAATIVDAVRIKWHRDDEGHLTGEPCWYDTNFEWDTRTLQDVVCAAIDNGLDWGLDSQHMRKCIGVLSDEQAAYVFKQAVRLNGIQLGISPQLTELPGGRLPLTKEMLTKTGLVWESKDGQPAPHAAMFTRPFKGDISCND